eukprot:GDKI01023509.1.p1 GENE.GDKI01023509.1~~GDKI01023509.1.p1  ORF type:complete len:175 (+),score=56.09 GDKI01023509.1:31-525(+)
MRTVVLLGVLALLFAPASSRVLRKSSGGDTADTSVESDMLSDIEDMKYVMQLEKQHTVLLLEMAGLAEKLLSNSRELEESVAPEEQAAVKAASEQETKLQTVIQTLTKTSAIQARHTAQTLKSQAAALIAAERDLEKQADTVLDSLVASEPQQKQADSKATVQK